VKSRRVSAEVLDGLAGDNAAAQRSRRDLRRIHRAMGSRGLLSRALQTTNLWHPDTATLRILEIGAGDGYLMLGVARQLRERWPRVELTLLDRLDLVEPATLTAYAALGWTARPQVADVLHWAQATPDGPWDLIIANLFLHHFEGRELQALLSAIEARAQCFLACEPRRSWLANAGSHLVGALGANAVTRTDAVLSVAAGFRDTELSALWPGSPGRWTLQEHAAGLFSQCLLAQRRATRI
jgi:hypothetical protein